MVKILIDTNFFLIPSQYGVDIFTEFERIMDEEHTLCTIDLVVDELNRLTTKGTGADKKAAKLGLKLLEAKKIEVLKTEKHLNTDNQIVKVAKSPNFIVATRDKELKGLLQQNNTKIIVLRSNSHLELV